LEKAGRIFEPFYTTKEQGTGMGLAGVYATVRSHGGSIEVRSKPGEGSVFSIYIPLEAKTALLDARSNALSPARAEMVRGAGRIIVADDNELNLAFMSEMLRGIGYDVIPCEDGRQVMERYKSGWRDFAMAILDVDMPEMDGVAAFKAMRSINPSAKAIFVTGLTDSRKSQVAAGAGAVALIRKPFDPRELSRKIAAAIDE
jgi:CheY-like chemotaxis protein